MAGHARGCSRRLPGRPGPYRVGVQVLGVRLAGAVRALVGGPGRGEGSHAAAVRQAGQDGLWLALEALSYVPGLAAPENPEERDCEGAGGAAYRTHAAEKFHTRTRSQPFELDKPNVGAISSALAVPRQVALMSSGLHRP